MNDKRTDAPPQPTDRDLRIGGERLPIAADPGSVEGALADLRRAAEENGCVRLAALCANVDSRDRMRLGAALALSPYLREVALRHPLWLDRLFDEEAGERTRAVVRNLHEGERSDLTESELMGQLRAAKLEASLLIALRDLFGASDVRRTAADLSDMADAAVSAGLRYLLLDLQRRGKLMPSQGESPETGSGLFVLAMGKLGAHELNYSSDIDLIVLFDPDAAAIADREEAVDTFSRLVRRLVRILNERTAGGYVFRTDLRLRPDPGAMPLAIPVPAALAYYESSGRNWERAAMIKARPIAGDIEAAGRFLAEMRPFVWRRYLDFAAVADIRSMKSRIDRHRGFEGVGIAGHDVKLGPGGIREIEFFAQGQQLIAGGRAPAMRGQRTDDALRSLAAGGWIADDLAARMTDAYWFLRRVEHAIQMVADEQSHVLPKDENGLRTIAGLLGYADTGAFVDALLPVLSLVETQFDQLFRAPDEERADGRRLYSLMESGAIDALAHELAGIGFARPDSSARVLSNWAGDRYRALRSATARERLAEVLPDLLRAFANAPDADGALAAFDAFLAGLPTGVQFFSLVASNPRIAELLTSILAAAPALAATIAQRPHVFDAFLDPSFFRELPDRKGLASRFESFVADARSYEERLVRLRLFASEQRFLVGTRLFSGTIGAAKTGVALSDVADTAIGAALLAAEASFAERHGRVSGGRIALFGMGRLGSRELAIGSDVDLILFYDHAGDAELSDGAKPLAASLYFGRLTQRLIAALSSPMGEGILYEVDFRLRPSGNMGPLATRLSSFQRYQQGEARVWERMALTRSRFVAGDEGLAKEAREAIAATLVQHRGDADTGREIATMRLLLEREKPFRGPLDLKRRIGGLTDIEFVAQWALLTGRAPIEGVGRPTRDVLASATPPLPSVLGDALGRFSRVFQLSRLGPADTWTLEALAPQLAERIAKAIGAESVERIERAIDETAAVVAAEFQRLLPKAS